MTLENFNSAGLLLGSSLLFAAAVVFFVGGSLAKYEVIVYKKNGLTWLMGTFLYSVGFVFLTTSAIAFYGFLSLIHPWLLLIVVWLRNLSIAYMLFACYRLVRSMASSEAH